MSFRMNLKLWRRQHTQPSTLPSGLATNIFSTRSSAFRDRARVQTTPVLEVTQPTAELRKFCLRQAKISPYLAPVSYAKTSQVWRKIPRSAPLRRRFPENFSACLTSAEQSAIVHACTGLRGALTRITPRGAAGKRPSSQPHRQRVSSILRSLATVVGATDSARARRYELIAFDDSSGTFPARFFRFLRYSG